MPPIVTLLMVLGFTVGLWFFAKRGQKSPLDEAKYQLEQGNTIRAEMAMGRALKEAERKHGSKSVQAADLRLQLAALLSTGGDLEQAMAYVHEALAVEGDAETRAPWLTTYTHAVGDRAVEHLKHKEIDDARRLLDEVIKVGVEGSATHGAAKGVLDALNAGRPVDFKKQEERISNIFTKKVQAKVGSDLVARVQIQLGLVGLMANPVFEREPTPDEAEAFQAAFQGTMAELESKGVDGFLAG